MSSVAVSLKKHKWTTASVAVAVAAAFGCWWYGPRVLKREEAVVVAEKPATKSPSDDVADVVADALAKADPEQQRLMSEHCILVNKRDKVIGHGSKKDCHLMVNIRKGMLHRAFSVFLFNSKGQLLLQKRSSAKITFPAYWANTCCSHPLATPEELVEEGHAGVISAARRKMEQELGINPAEVPVESFKFLTRVYYQASSDDVWGEHEVDHILICRPPKDVTLNVNPNEVAEARYFDIEDIKPWVESAAERGDLVSPWFNIIQRDLLPKWWAAMKADDLDKFVDEETIHEYN